MHRCDPKLTMAYSWRFRSFLAFAFTICINHAVSVSESEAQTSYAKHCSSLIPPYEITAPSDGDSLPSLYTTYFTGGDDFRLVRRHVSEHDVSKYLRLRLSPDHNQTTAAGVHSVQGFLYITFAYGSGDDPKLGFTMSGLWSEKSRNLCMVGSAPWKGTDLDAVLKLKFDSENPTVYTSVVSGSMESTASADDPAYFDPVYIFDFPTEISDYSYSLVPEELAGGAPPSRKEDSLSLESVDFCGELERGLIFLELEYPPECAEQPPTRSCSPFGFRNGLLPYDLSLTSIQCDERGKRARFLARFKTRLDFGYFTFPLNSTAVGEAWWDGESNRIIGAACGVSNPSLNLGNSVGDCSIRLSFRRPAVLTMRNKAGVVGEIWSSEGEDGSGYFNPIRVSSRWPMQHSGQRYEYREIDRARESCRGKKAGKKGKDYPDGKSDAISYLNLEIVNGSGDGDYLGTAYFVAVRSENESDPELLDRELKMRYQVSIYLNRDNNASKPSLDWAASKSTGQITMTVEGVYDPETGQLCMVGCRKVALNSVTNIDDCEVAMEVAVPPWNESSYIKGSIASTRPPTDVLHFDHLILESRY